eukprot:scaffold2994_cov29-Attheya_sp.AAC.1
MVLRPGGGGGNGERRCIRIVEGAVLDFVSLQYQFWTAAHVEAALILFYYSQISRLSSTTDLFYELLDFWNRLLQLRTPKAGLEESHISMRQMTKWLIRIF